MPTATLDRPEAPASGSVLDMALVDFGRTATYSRRLAYWQWATPEQEREDGRLGTLTVRMQKGERPGSKVVTDVYAVQAVDPRGQYGLGFYLAKLTGEEARVHECLPAGAVPPAMIRCTCDAANCKLPVCCHRDALAKLIADGVI